MRIFVFPDFERNQIPRNDVWKNVGIKIFFATEIADDPLIARNNCKSFGETELRLSCSQP